MLCPTKNHPPYRVLPIRQVVASIDFSTFDMEDFKLIALNNFLKSKGIRHKFGCIESKESYILCFVNNIPIYARLANTPETLQRGLMGVAKLGHNEGCLLHFGKMAPISLWMKNCKINLQAATIDREGKIIDILDMYHTDPYRAHRSSKSVQYALEMSEGFFTENNIKAGDSIKITLP